MYIHVHVHVYIHVAVVYISNPYTNLYVCRYRALATVYYNVKVSNTVYTCDVEPHTTSPVCLLLMNLFVHTCVHMDLHVYTCMYMYTVGTYTVPPAVWLTPAMTAVLCVIMFWCGRCGSIVCVYTECVCTLASLP